MKRPPGSPNPELPPAERELYERALARVSPLGADAVETFHYGLRGYQATEDDADQERLRAYLGYWETSATIITQHFGQFGPDILNRAQEMAQQIIQNEAEYDPYEDED